MDYALEERIGNPDLFTGRKEELAYFLKLEKQYKSLLGKYNYREGYFAEYLILEQLRIHAQGTMNC